MKGTVKNLTIAISINIVIVVFETAFGVLIGSLALIADALHNLFDVASMTLSILGEKIASRQCDLKKTYGYKRAEIIIAFVNGSILLAVVLFILIKSVQRLFHPGIIKAPHMIAAATVALLGNGLATYVLERDARRNLNLKSAWLHSLHDALFSLGVVIGAVLIHLSGLYIIDPVISIGLAVFIIYVAYKLIIEAVNILMDSVPGDIDFDMVRDDLLQLEGVREVNDLHIWQTGAGNRLLTVHLKTDDLAETKRIELVHKIQKLAIDKYRIHHTTIQTAPVHVVDQYCRHCNLSIEGRDSDAD
jgi:cobalt-zinc-cadmium efflux system protein